MRKPADSELPSSMGDDSGGREEWTQNDPNDVELGVVASDNSVQTIHNATMTKLMMNTLMS